MSAAFTPGPWSSDKYGHIVSPSGDVMFRSLSILASSSAERMAEAEANTTLAAAAPDLLAALQGFMQNGMDGPAEYEAAVLAISKAIGSFA